MSDKQTIINKLNQLEKLINKNHENGEDLFPKHWLILLQVKNEVNKKNDGQPVNISREILESMNRIWKINKAIDKAGSSDQFELEIWEQIDKLCPYLIKGKGFNDMPKAVRLFQESFVKEDGSEYTLSEAKDLIEFHAKNGKNS